MCRYKKKREEAPISSVSVSTLNHLHDLFVRKNWEIDEDSDISTYTRYYRTLQTLNEDQQNFIIAISDDFLHISQSQYFDNLIEPLSRLRVQYSNDNLIFLPCSPKKDVGAIKSSASVLYQLKGTSIKTKVHLNPYWIPARIDEKWFNCLPKNGQYKIVLVDDFVGSGETAEGAVDYIHELVPALDNSSIKILSIVAMQNGINRLKTKDIDVYCRYVRNRGISDRYSGEDLLSTTKMMQDIEATLDGLTLEMRFGYRQTEALVCMERCPNNTFPIYWKTANIAPYER